MKLKSKLCILGTTGVSTLAAFTPLALSSCSKKNNENKVANHVTQNGDDIKYGLNAKTYSDVKNNYTVKFQDQMISKGIKKDSETWNNEMSQLNTALNAFDQISQNSPMSYTVLTNGVIDYARKTHGLTLRRTTTANFNDIEEEFQGAVEAFKDYAQHQHLPTSQIKQIVNSATSAYKQKLADLERDGYKQNDPYGALLKIRANLFDFFNAGNAVIAKLAGYTKLANYQNQYVFSYKKNTNSAYIDNIVAKKLVIGQDMTNVFDEIFEIYDNERGVKVDHFDPAAIPGYTITPVYQGIEINKDSNQSEIKFSLEILSNNYKNTNDDARIMATAKKLAVPKDEQHFYAEIKKLTKIEGKNVPLFTNAFFDLFDKVNETYGAFYSSTKEKENLINTYFNNQNENYISFVFPVANERTRYESFFTGNSLSDVHKLKTQDLADVGLQISDGKNLFYLADVIKSVEVKQKVENFNPSTLSFVEKFVYYCNIEGISAIKDRITHRVSTNISVNYRNTQNAKESCYIIENLECIGYIPTIQSFMRMSLEYNKANKIYGFYSNPETINNARTWDLAWSAYANLSGAGSLYYLLYWENKIIQANKQIAEEASMIAELNLGEYRATVASYIMRRLYLSIGQTVACGILGFAFQQYRKESFSLYRGIRSLFKEDYVKQLKTFMEEGEKIFVKMYGNHFDQFDKTERDKKFAEFSSHPEKYDHYRSLVDQYKIVYKEDSTFDKLIKKYNVPFKRVNDFYDSRTFAFNAPVLITLFCQVFSVFNNCYLFKVTIWDEFKNSLSTDDLIDMSEISSSTSEAVWDKRFNEDSIDFALAAEVEMGKRADEAIDMVEALDITLNLA